MPLSEDDKFMRRCLDLASRAEGMTYPNPLVGSLVVHDGVIIGEGYHMKSGLPHAEVNAINSVSDRLLLGRSTLYVSLEPCSHSGKTPPCADFIISAGIPKVVIGTTDTSDKVSGTGINRLKAAGCEVISGVLENECREINRRFFTFHEKKRPYITLKWARSSDGFMDFIRSGNQEIGPNWITGMPERVLVHKWRASEQAILVGGKTARTDNPKLNLRYWPGNDPLRIILSGTGDLDDYLGKNAGDGTIIVFTFSSKDFEGKVRKFRMKEDTLSSVQVAEFLYKHGIQSLLIEGGAEVLNHFIESNLWDEARIFTGEAEFKDGVKAPVIRGRTILDEKFEKSHLVVICNE
jgi:diaminohydroxyphosphoribosylaminopyrimidine deaminase/5-amino-6-(5-phosphoribosylamino)uracil reductase